jgi:hypothetical protein
MNYELLADVAQVIMGESPPSSTYNAVGSKPISGRITSKALLGGLHHSYARATYLN